MREARGKVVVALVIFVALLLPLAALYFGQEKLIYFPRAYSPDDPDLAEVVTITYRSGGLEQRSFLFRPGGSGPDRIPADRIWWFFGGNGSLALDWLDVIRDAGPEAGEAFLLFDYPGYGFNPGKPNPMTIANSVDEAFSAVAAELGMDEDELVARSGVVGHSLGGAVAIDTADRYELDRVIVVSTFTTMRDMAKRQVGRFLAPFVRHRYDNVTPLGRLARRGDVGIMLFHGERDEIVPFEMGKELYTRSASSSGDGLLFLPVPGAGHNDVLLHLGKDLLELLANPHP